MTAMWVRVLVPHCNDNVRPWVSEEYNAGSVSCALATGLWDVLVTEELREIMHDGVY